MAQDAAETLAVTTSRGFEGWLARSGVSIAFSTYQAGKLFMIGPPFGDGGRLWIHERTFARCMGIAISEDARRIFLAAHYQIYRFDNILPPGETVEDGIDAVFVPRMAWFTGDLDTHDMAIGADGRPLFVNTAFGCLATVEDGHSFRPLWQPPFLSRFAAEDRCHLNGLATEAGQPRFVTAVSQSDVADGWRDRRRDGGVVIDVADNRIVAQGLSMPHSPRLYRGRLWLLNSGTGEFGHVDPATGQFTALCFCPGYARGLAFAGDHAVIGLSLPRDNRAFQGLALDEALRARDTQARCGLIVVDLTSGDITAWLRLEGVVRELYDVQVLPGLRRPSAIGFKTDEITRLISVGGG